MRSLATRFRCDGLLKMRVVKFVAMVMAAIGLALVVPPTARAQTITEFALPTADSQPSGIAAWPDGALWFTQANGSRIGRITTAGVITEFTLPCRPCSPSGIAAGPDGALWFTQFSGDRIGRITTGVPAPVPTLSE